VSLDSKMKTQGVDGGVVVRLIDRVDILGPVSRPSGGAAGLVVGDAFAADVLIVVRLFAVHAVRSRSVVGRVVARSLEVVTGLLLLLTVVALVVAVVLEVVPLLVLLLRLLGTHGPHWWDGSDLIEVVFLLASHDRSSGAERVLDLVLLSSNVKCSVNRPRLLLLNDATQILGQSCPEDLERHVAVDVLVSGPEDFKRFFIRAVAGPGRGDRESGLLREVLVHEFHNTVHLVVIGDGVLSRLH